MNRFFSLSIGAVAGTAFAAACVGTVPASDGDTGLDASLDGDAAVGADDADGQVSATDAGFDVLAEAGEAGPVYGDFTDSARWSFYDMATLTGSKNGYAGGTFDGRYVYYVPQVGAAAFGLLVRFDTTKAFADPTAWDKFDLATIDGKLVGFANAIFDGKYVYLVPYRTDAAFHGLTARYDTTKSFTAASSYETFDLVTKNALAVGFSAGASDGNYVYYPPFINRNVTVRYDRAKAFDAAAFETHTLSLAGDKWTGAAYAKPFIYYVSYYDQADQPNAAVARYDTGLGFDANPSWLRFDVAAEVDVNAKGSSGAAYDGRYLYVTPGIGSLVVRYDTTQPFEAAASWTKFDLASKSATAKSYSGSTFDGRFLYLAPSGHGLAMRYDTQSSFGDAQSWQMFSLPSVNAAAKGFIGTVFDGRHVYFVPYSGTVAARFDAKTPASLPPFASSFY